jgi:hypothetical protein
VHLIFRLLQTQQFFVPLRTLRRLGEGSIATVHSVKIHGFKETCARKRANLKDASRCVDLLHVIGGEEEGRSRFDRG